MSKPLIKSSLKSNVGAVISAKDERVEAAMIAIGAQAETYAKTRCPIGTPESTGIPGYIGGTLRGSITFATSTQHSGGKSPAEAKDFEAHGTPKKGTVVIGTNVEYAIYVEKGTSKMAARPYLGPAISDHIGEYETLLRSILRG